MEICVICGYKQYMNLKERKELLRLLELYFAKTNFNRSNLLARDPVLALLKKNLMNLSYWKNKARGSRKFKGSNCVQLAKSLFTSTTKINDCPF